ncbi:MAG: UDP-N-acetylmuramate dehydrogenase [Saprospiraceae bacterium]|nr:UDP-N-acetylmuramate dehydrogenase [Saprospiraceae bacterium]
MKRFKNISLKDFNTFGIDVKAKELIEFKNDNEISNYIRNDFDSSIPSLILGGGSNILFTKDYEGLILKINTKGIELIREDDSHYYIKAMAGEVWKDFVDYCIERNYCGVENLSLIPGNIGAAAVQNIGAYGVEIKDVIYEVQGIDILSGELRSFTNEECKFDYRNSIFKTDYKGKFIIQSVVLKLNKSPEIKKEYGAIEDELKNLGVKKPTIQDIGKAVCNIRERKLPDYTKIGNAGSFFKNPVINSEHFFILQNEYPEIAYYKIDDESYKIAAGWLIEKAGWKGKIIGNAGVHKKQALVLVNLGNSKGSEIQNLAIEIQNSILEKFHIYLEMEVLVV